MHSILRDGSQHGMLDLTFSFNWDLEEGCYLSPRIIWIISFTFFFFLSGVPISRENIFLLLVMVSRFVGWMYLQIGMCLLIFFLMLELMIMSLIMILVSGL